MICRICRRELAEDMLYCPGCGRPIRDWDKARAADQIQMDLHLLEALLQYHERVRAGVLVTPPCEKSLNGHCAETIFADYYADALREGIRCIRLYHGID